MTRLKADGLFLPRAVLPILSLIWIAFPQHYALSLDLPTQEVQERTTKIAQSIMDGISEGDYEKYAQDFSEAMKKGVDREGFLQMQASLRRAVGKFQSIEYIGFYVQEGSLFALFKARFRKEKDDVLIRLVIDWSKEPKVTGLWFDAPALRK